MMIRTRRTRAQMGQLAAQIIDVLGADHPQSARHVFYRMTDPRLPEPVAKSEAGYTTVQRMLVQMRRSGEIPYSWVRDAGRFGYFPEAWSSIAEAVAATAKFYRRSYWASAPVYVEVWCESRSLAGVISGDCDALGVPLYPSGGFASLSLLYEAAEHIRHVAAGRPVKLFYVGDYDASGLLIDRKIEAGLRGHLPDADITFRRLGITREQIALMGLPTKPAKDRRGGFEGDTVEAEAMPAGTMRQIVRDAIEAFVDPHEASVLQAAEASERNTLLQMAGYLKDFNC